MQEDSADNVHDNVEKPPTPYEQLLGTLQEKKQVLHYQNTPTAIFHRCENDNFQNIFFYYFHIFAKNIYCGYTLEPPH